MFSDTAFKRKQIAIRDAVGEDTELYFIFVVHVTVLTRMVVLNVSTSLYMNVLLRACVRI